MKKLAFAFAALLAAAGSASAGSQHEDCGHAVAKNLSRAYMEKHCSDRLGYDALDHLGAIPSDSSSISAGNARSIGGFLSNGAGARNSK